MSGPDGFLDLLYEASADSALWPQVLEQFAELVGGESSALIWQDQRDRSGRGIAARLDPGVLDLYFRQFSTRHPTQRWVNDPGQRVRHFVPHIVADDDAMPKSELMRTDFYNQFMRPHDMHSIVRLGLAEDRLTTATVMVSRPRRRERFEGADYEALAALHPHLIRSFKLSRRFDFLAEVSDLWSETIDRLPQGFFLLDADGVVRRSSRAGEALLRSRSGLRLIGGRLHAGSPEATHRLHALVAAASIRSERRRGGTMSVSRPDLRHPLLVSVAPAKADRFAGFASGPSVIVCVSDLAGNDAPPSQRLRDLFGLSPAETRVALALFDGLSPREAAESLGVSFYTVRGHLVRLFEKTQTKRQSELIKLIQRAAGLAAD